jgi:hypothetical protein
MSIPYRLHTAAHQGHQRENDDQQDDRTHVNRLVDAKPPMIPLIGSALWSPTNGAIA